MNSKLAKLLRKQARGSITADALERKYVGGTPPHPLRTKIRRQVEVDGKLLGLQPGVPQRLSPLCWRYDYRQLKKEYK